MNRLLRGYLAWAGRVGADLNDNDDVRLQKSLLVAAAPVLIVVGVAWGLMYLAFGETTAAMIPSSYAVLSTVSLLLFARGRRLALYRFTELALILLLPFLLQIALGGFVPSSAVILWSLICPIGALVFAGPRQAIAWFLVYVALVITSGFLQAFARPANNLPPVLIVTFFVLNISMISAIVFGLLAFFIGQKDAAFGLLRVERERSENLLLNILPREIAETLKHKSGTIADQYDQVSILFADIVNFTPLSAELSPAKTVGLLNEIFTRFDGMVDTYNVEKIETVGDEYMAACGVPRPCPEHAQALARLALEMCSFISTLPPINGKRLDIRIGIHSGPIIAGVIGRKKFAFELFGDTVNTANRMQSHGLPGKIQISRATYDLLKDSFVCEPRGQVMIKGKGEMETWFLVGPKIVSARSAETAALL